jgi:hypothetical protein
MDEFVEQRLKRGAVFPVTVAAVSTTAALRSGQSEQ